MHTKIYDHEWTRIDGRWIAECCPIWTESMEDEQEGDYDPEIEYREDGEYI